MKKTVNSVNVPLESVTLQDVAQRCNVHKSTVYRALVGSKRVGKATTRRIQTVAQEMGYDHGLNLAAQQLSARKTGRAVINHLVVLFLPDGFLEDFYYAYLFRGIQKELHRNRYDLITSILDRTRQEVLPLSIVRGDVDGVLMLCNQESGEWLLDTIKQKGNIAHCPLVSVMSPLAGCSSVVADERNGAFLALSHLLDLGHRKILFLTGPYVPPYHLNERLEGYRRACKEADLVFEDVVETHILAANKSLTKSLHDLTTHYFDGKKGFSAVMTRNDAHAVVLRRVLSQNGLRVPEDVSLIGFDDTRPLTLQYAETNEEFLTTVRLPLEDIGHRAAQLLVQSITTAMVTKTVMAATTHEVNLHMPVQLLIRQTTTRPSRDLTFSERVYSREDVHFTRSKLQKSNKFQKDV